MRHALARSWARLVVAGSVCLFLAGLVAGACVLFLDVWPGLEAPTRDARLLAAALLVLAGLVLATPGILLGEVVLVLLAQRRLLARIDGRLRRRRALDDEHEPPAARRLLSRRDRRE